MDIESLRLYCLSLPHCTEDQAFGEDNLLFRVCGHIFVCCGLDGDDYLAMKCDPELALDLRDRYAEIVPAWHWNKKYWNQVKLRGRLSDEFIKSLIRHSYSEVVKKLPKRVKSEFTAIVDVGRDECFFG